MRSYINFLGFGDQRMYISGCVYQNVWRKTKIFEKYQSGRKKILG